MDSVTRSIIERDPSARRGTQQHLLAFADNLRLQLEEAKITPATLLNSAQVQSQKGRVLQAAALLVNQTNSCQLIIEAMTVARKARTLGDAFRSSRDDLREDVDQYYQTLLQSKLTEHHVSVDDFSKHLQRNKHLMPTNDRIIKDAAALLRASLESASTVLVDGGGGVGGGDVRRRGEPPPAPAPAAAAAAAVVHQAEIREGVRKLVKPPSVSFEKIAPPPGGKC